MLHQFVQFYRASISFINNSSEKTHVTHPYFSPLVCCAESCHNLAVVLLCILLNTANKFPGFSQVSPQQQWPPALSIRSYEERSSLHMTLPSSVKKSDCYTLAESFVVHISPHLLDKMNRWLSILPLTVHLLICPLGI